MRNQVDAATQSLLGVRPTALDAYGPDRRWADTVWTSDVAFEMWIDAEPGLVAVRLAGSLSAATAPRLLAVVSELVGDGHRDFVLWARDLDVSDTAGAEALMDLELLITRSGGRVAWDGPTIPR